MSELTIELLKQEMGVTDSYLNMEIEEADLLELAAYFDNIEYYLEMLGLTPGEQTDVRSCTNSSGTRFGMMLALKYWSNRDPFEATYRTLLLILLSLQKRDIAIRVFKYLSHKQSSTGAEKSKSIEQEYLNTEHDLHEKKKEQQQIFHRPVSSTTTLDTPISALEKSRELVVGVCTGTSFPSSMVTLSGQQYTHEITTGLTTKDKKGDSTGENPRETPSGGYKGSSSSSDVKFRKKSRMSVRTHPTSSESSRGSSSKSKSGTSGEQQAVSALSPTPFSSEAQEDHGSFMQHTEVAGNWKELPKPIKGPSTVATEADDHHSKLLVSSHPSSSARHSPLAPNFDSTRITTENQPSTSFSPIHPSKNDPSPHNLPAPSGTSDYILPTPEHVHPQQPESSTHHTPQQPTDYNPRSSTSAQYILPQQQQFTASSNLSQSQVPHHPGPSSPSVPKSSSPLPPTLVYSQSDPDYQAVKSAAECLHAHDYPKMASILERALRTIAVLFGKGLAYYKLAKYSHATNAFEDMLHESEGNPGYIGNVYLAHYYIGEIDLGHSRYEQAARHFDQSAAAFCTQTLAKRYRIVPPSQAILYSKRGSALNHSKKVMDAVESYKEAISVALTPKDKLAARTSLGNLYQSLGDNKNALEQYEETVKLAEQLGDFVYLGWAHGNMGNAYLGLLQKDKALHHLEKSLDLTVRYEPSPQAIGRAYNNLGTAHQSLGDVSKAEEYYDLALSQAIYGRDLGGQARAYGNIGNLLMIQKKFEPAILHYSEALAISKDHATKATAYHNRGCASYEKAEADKIKFFARVNAQSKDAGSSQGLLLVTYKGPNVHQLPQAPSHLPSSIHDNYEQGRNDLMKVVDNHEETIRTIKGSTQGLTLSVSLSETNSRTFHRLQDCLFNLDQWDRALEYAEQSRARSLGELLLERKGPHLDPPLASPLKTEQINRIIDRVDMTVVYISYTGSRLLVWVFTPVHGHMTTKVFQVTLSDDQFDGKSLDYYLRYSLSEILIESNMEMYSVTTYEEPSPLTVLFDLIGRPLLNVLESVYTQTNATEPKDIVLIPDSYTNLMPVVAFMNHQSQQFLGDKYRFRYMPSLLTMGVLYQLPQVVVEVLHDSSSFCVVGNPTIPTFKYQGDTWNLGKLPHATKEAQWVAHILRCSPTLHDQATKMLILSMMNTAKVVHLATHGSAVSGFLAFAGRGSSRSKDIAEDKMVLLYPEEVEKLSISPALVVLSSCDSGRGVVKADGIQGMARAFILAGAQSVLTSLWRVPDESASTFMQFFYQYLMDGLKSSTALQKAILSVRAFAKYSRYIHWSGYQLTGREVSLVAKRTPEDEEVRGRVGVTAVFPRLNVIKKLETAFVKEPRVPTDVQLVHGLHGLKPSEPVIDFINKYHNHFSGGVFWINGSSPEFVRASELQIQKVLSTLPSPSIEPTLVVLDGFTSLPEPGPLFTLLRSNNTHIIVLTHTLSLPDNLRGEINQWLIRGLNVITLKPLSKLHSTQRMVYSVVSEHEFAPHPREQTILSDIADKVGGSPAIVDVTSALLRRCTQEHKSGEDFLEEFSNRVLKPLAIEREGSASEELSITQFTSHVIDGFNLSKTEHLLLSVLAMFGPVPVPKSVVEKAQSYVMRAKPSSEIPGSLMPLSNLISAKLLLEYPSPVIAAPKNSVQTSHPRERRGSSDSTSLEEQAECFYVPQLIKDALWDSMSPLDHAIAITTSYKCIKQGEQLLLSDST